MKMVYRFLSFIVPLIMICATPVLPGTAHAGKPPAIQAGAVVLMEAKTGKVLYAKNAHRVLPPASTTKIMTAILAIEEGDLRDEVWVGPRAARERGSSMHLTRGERRTLEELLYGLLLPSGNDAAVAIAEHIAGTEWGFAQMMTEKAKRIGLKNTGFQNASGLPAYGHYSTAYDLAVLTRYALQNRVFARIVRTKVKTVPGPGKGSTRRLRNNNRLLWDYKYATGVKTGYTSSAGSCLVASATKNGKTLIAVILRSAQRFTGAERLFEYGFALL